mgnify:FL=1|jgi:hypothetical protein|tara:strand:- start:16 stop:309 length:294 start_codon:yes stop_codon:yes gene_type:complete
MDEEELPLFKFRIGQLVIRHAYKPYSRDLGIVISKCRYVFDLPEYEVYWTIEAAREWVTQYELDGSLRHSFSTIYTVVEEGKENEIDWSWDSGGDID